MSLLGNTILRIRQKRYAEAIFSWNNFIGALSHSFIENVFLQLQVKDLGPVVQNQAGPRSAIGRAPDS